MDNACGTSALIYARHGVISQADDYTFHVLELIEYPEAAAHYETLNLFTGEKANKLSRDEIRQCCVK